MEFSEKIKDVRSQLGVSQEKLAKLLDVSFSTVNRWEGRKAKPNLTAIKIIKEFCLKHDVYYAGIE